MTMKRWTAALVATAMLASGAAFAQGTPRPWSTSIWNSPDVGTVTGAERIGVATGPGQERFMTPNELATFIGGGGGAGVSSFNTRTGAVTLSATDVGGAITTTAPLHFFVTGISPLGIFSTAQVGVGDLQGIPASTVVGNATGATGVPTALTSAQLTALVSPFTATLSGAVPPSGGGTANFLRSDGVFATPAGAGNVSGPGLSVNNNVVTWSGVSGTNIKDSGVAIGSLLVANQTITLSGDASGTGATSIVVANTKVNGVSYPAAPSVHQSPVVVAAGTISYKTLPACTDTLGNHLNYDQTTDTYSCGTSIPTVTLSGDATGTGTTAITMTVPKVNGVSYPASPALHSTAVTTAANTETYKVIPACLDATGNHLNYDQSTDTFSCGTSSGTPTITLTGDTTGTGGTSITTTTGKVNGVSFPTSPALHSVPITTASLTEAYKVISDCTDTAGNHLNYTQSTDTWSCGTSSSASGVGSVTTTSAGLTVSPTTGNVVVNPAFPTQTKTASYTFVAADMAQLTWFNSASAVTATIPQAIGSFANNTGFCIGNRNTGVVTLSPVTSTIYGIPLLTLGKNQGACFYSDSTNWGAQLISNVQSLVDTGTLLQASEPIDLTSQPILTEVANAGTTGTTVNKLAKLTGAPSTALIAATTDTDNVLGIVVGGAGTTGNAQIAIVGQASCVFDGATTAGDYVQISATTAGDCHDAGATRPTGSLAIGRVLSTNGAGGTFAVALTVGFTGTGAGGSGTVNTATAGQIAAYASSGTAVSGETVSGDCTHATGGAFTCTKTSGTLFGTAATQNTGTSGANIPLLSTNNTWGKGQAVSPFALTDGASIAVDATQSNSFTVTLAGNRALANPTGIIAGQFLEFSFLQDATGSRTLSYGTNFKFPGGTAPVLTTAANAEDDMSCWARTTVILICQILSNVH